VSCYRFHERTEQGWRYAGWDAAEEHGDGDIPVVEAFRHLVKAGEFARLALVPCGLTPSRPPATLPPLWRFLGRARHLLEVSRAVDQNADEPRPGRGGDSPGRSRSQREEGEPENEGEDDRVATSTVVFGLSVKATTSTGQISAKVQIGIKAQIRDGDSPNEDRCWPTSSCPEASFASST